MDLAAGSRVMSYHPTGDTVRQLERAVLTCIQQALNPHHTSYGEELLSSAHTLSTFLYVVYV